MNTDPVNIDDWADLAEELGVSEMKPQASALPEPRALDEDDEADELESVEVVSEEDDYEAADGAVESDEEEPRKRRRRRRRRKKKNATETVGNAETSDEEAEDTVEDEADDEEADAVQRGESLEDTTPEAARDLIQNWNVPNWEEIVSGLYRPER